MTAAATDPLTVGYHLSVLYASVGWLSWARIAWADEAARGSDGATGRHRFKRPVTQAGVPEHHPWRDLDLARSG